MNRRSFLSLSGIATGSFLVPDEIARRIHDVCLGNSHPLILAPSNPAFDLYAVESYGSYMLHRGSPDAEPDYPMLREFMEDRGFDPDDDVSLRDYLVGWRSYDEESAEALEGAIAELKKELDQPIEWGELAHWMDWDYETKEGTLPQAYRYLLDLPLKDEHSPSGLGLGRLSFIEGDRPGSNLTYVEADGLAAIASLQQRLNELKTGARIVIA